MTRFSIEDELVWFWNNSEADCGVRSNWGAMVNAKLDAVWSDPYTDGLLISIRKRRRVESALDRVDVTYRRALYAAYGPIRVENAIREVMGHLLAPVAVCCVPTEVKDFVALCSRVVRGSATASDLSQINKIRITAIELRANAIAAYVKAKGEK